MKDKKDTGTEHDLSYQTQMIRNDIKNEKIKPVLAPSVKTKKKKKRKTSISLNKQNPKQKKQNKKKTEKK